MDTVDVDVERCFLEREKQNAEMMSSRDRFREAVLFLLINVRSVAQLHLRPPAAAELARKHSQSPADVGQLLHLARFLPLTICFTTCCVPISLLLSEFEALYAQRAVE